jgi:hypothetical protein
MCNCYIDNCKICKSPIPIHLGDYLTKPEEIECYCKSYIPIKNVRVFTIKNSIAWNGNILKRGWKIGIRCLTDNANKNKNQNFPNLGVDMIEVDL